MLRLLLSKMLLLLLQRLLLRDVVEMAWKSKLLLLKLPVKFELLRKLYDIRLVCGYFLFMFLFVFVVMH